MNALDFIGLALFLFVLVVVCLAERVRVWIAALGDWAWLRRMRRKQ